MDIYIYIFRKEMFDYLYIYIKVLFTKNIIHYIIILKINSYFNKVLNIIIILYIYTWLFIIIICCY